MTPRSSLRRTLLGIGAGLALVLAGCAQRTTDEASRNGKADAGAPATTTNDTGAKGRPTEMTDAEILGVLSTVNHGEVKAAELAQERSSTPAIDEFAQHMIHAHSEAQGKLLAVDSLEPDTSGSLSRSLEQQADADMAKLQGLTGAEFDRAYADSQAKAHQQVLDTIDSTLMAQASSPQVKSLLETLRPQVAEHLTLAQQLGSASPPAGGGAR